MNEIILITLLIFSVSSQSCYNQYDASLCVTNCCNISNSCATGPWECNIYANDYDCSDAFCPYCCNLTDDGVQCGHYIQCQQWLITIVCIWVFIAVGIICFMIGKRRQNILLRNQMEEDSKAEADAIQQRIQQEKARAEQSQTQTDQSPGLTQTFEIQTAFYQESPL